VLKHERGYKTLDLGSLVLLLAVLCFELATNHVSADVVILGKVEEFADVVGTLGSKAAGDGAIGEAFDVSVALLQDNQVDSGEVGANNATTHRLALALALAARAVARGALVEKERYTGGSENTLLHGETLLVVAARDAEDVALELFAEFVTLNFGRHALVVEDTELLLVIDVEALLHTRGRVGNVKLHGGCAWMSSKY